MKKLFGVIAGLVILSLVAISVISVLAGIILPALQRARQHAEIRGSFHEPGFVAAESISGQHQGFAGQAMPMRVDPVHGTLSLFAGGLIFLVVFGIVVLLVLRRIFSNPEKRKQREICYDELQQLSQSIAKLDSRLSSLEEIIAS